MLGCQMTRSSSVEIVINASHNNQIIMPVSRILNIKKTYFQSTGNINPSTYRVDFILKLQFLPQSTSSSLANAFTVDSLSLFFSGSVYLDTFCLPVLCGIPNRNRQYACSTWWTPAEEVGQDNISEIPTTECDKKISEQLTVPTPLLSRSLCLPLVYVLYLLQINAYQQPFGNSLAGPRKDHKTRR